MRINIGNGEMITISDPQPSTSTRYFDCSDRFAEQDCIRMEYLDKRIELENLESLMGGVGSLKVQAHQERQAEVLRIEINALRNELRAA